MEKDNVGFEVGYRYLTSHAVCLSLQPVGPQELKSFILVTKLDSSIGFSLCLQLLGLQTEKASSCIGSWIMVSNFKLSLHIA